MSIPDSTRLRRSRREGWGARLPGLLLTAALGLIALREAQGCAIPVFRYALERWKPVQYDAVVFHRGPLDAAQREALAALAGPQKEPINLGVTQVDLASKVPDPASDRLWKQQQNATTPWLILRAPDTGPKAAPVYAGPFEKAVTARLADSPARRTLAQRLLKGESAVWVMVESGDAERDAAAAKLLAERIQALEEEMRLPEFSADEPNEKSADEPPLLSNLPMKLRFSMLRLSENDAKETSFVEMLRRVDPKLKSPPEGGKNEPMVFPVFGQGRVLCALVGKNINADTIEDCAAFLTGGCSCNVKELNPGVDLLLAADWSSVLDANAPAETTIEVPEPVIASGKRKAAAQGSAKPAASK
jgi:hypothetical protein